MEYLIIIPLSYLIINVIYYLTFSVASVISMPPKNKNAIDKANKIAVLIPAYKEDEVIVETAHQASKHNYPKNKFDVFIIADQLQPSTLMKLERMKINIVEVNFVQSSKTKAINATLEQIKSYDLVVVLDADNIMASHFLSEINTEYNNGALAIQGQRIAKNEENSISKLDAISEGINNNIFRKGHQNMGLSCALIGSGMAFDFQLFRTHMALITALGGFDKELELSLLMSTIKIKYVPNAVIYDEKVSDKQSFSTQRTRWIAAQVQFGMKSFRSGLKQMIFGGNFDYFNKVFQFILLPRLILLGSLTILVTISLLFSQTLFLISLSVWLICGLALFIATPSQYLVWKNFSLLSSLPSLFFRMVSSIAGYKKASKNFLHTPHKTKMAS